MNVHRSLTYGAILCIANVALALIGCDDSFDACSNDSSCPPPDAAASGSAANGNGGGTSGASAGGAGGIAGAGGQPGCMTDANCTDPAKAHCLDGSCVPCDASPQCAAGNPTLPVCDQGTCVACALGEEDACVSPQTCDLVAKTCVEVAPGSVETCMACTNDLQCEAGLHCIAMNFMGSPHGYYCLPDVAPSCARPYAIVINAASISGAPAADYCSINQDLATCEAVWALLKGWMCSGTDGMCSPDGVMPEQPVPGAICNSVGPLPPTYCTYACDAAQQCPSALPAKHMR